MAQSIKLKSLDNYLVEVKKVVEIHGVKFAIHRPAFKYMNSDTITTSKKGWAVSEISTGYGVVLARHNCKTIDAAESTIKSIIEQVGEEKLRQSVQDKEIINPDFGVEPVSEAKPEPKQTTLDLSEPQEGESGEDMEQLHARALYAASFGASVVITGEWVWAAFGEKPEKEALSALKANGWRWAKRKAKWYYAGKPCASRRGGTPWNKIVATYGTEEITEESN